MNAHSLVWTDRSTSAGVAPKACRGRSLMRAVLCCVIAAAGISAQANGPTTPRPAPSGSPEQECCPQPSLLDNYSWLQQPLHQPEVDLEGNLSVDFPHPRPETGQQGKATLYGAEINVANRVQDPIFHDRPEAPFTGCIVATSIGDCGGSVPNGCYFETIVSLNPGGGSTEMGRCVCPPLVAGDPGGAGRKTPFKYITQLTTLPTVPLIFASTGSTADLWHHNYGLALSEQYVEIRHSDGTIARFEHASTGGQQYEIWRLDKVTDPFDNVTDYSYNATTGWLTSILYPSGIREDWTYGENPPGWDTSDAGYSYIQVSYYDTVTSTALGGSPSPTWGMVFKDVPGTNFTHFIGQLVRIYHPEMKFLVSPTAPLTVTTAYWARPVTHLERDEQGRIVEIRESRWWGTNLEYYDDSTQSTTRSTIESTFGCDYFPYGHIPAHEIGRVSAVWNPQFPIGQSVYRSVHFAYADASTRSVSGVILHSVAATDPDGNVTLREYEPETGRVWRVETQPGNDALNLPRADELDGALAALTQHGVDEPEVLRVDYDFDLTCTCQKPRWVEVSGLIGGSPQVSRTTYFEYQAGTRLLERVRAPNPSTANGLPLVETVYTYVSEADADPNVAWSARLPATITTPDGVLETTYVWRDRASSQLNGRMPERITQRVLDVRRQLDLGTTTTDHVVLGVVDLGFPGYPVGGYDPGPTVGKPAWVTDGDGVVTEIEYDSHGRLSATTVAGDVRMETRVNAWGSPELVQTNASAAEGHSATFEITSGLDDEIYSIAATVGGVATEAELGYDRWGNLVMVRRKNLDDTGAVPGTSGRAWIENHYGYCHHELRQIWEDRRPLDHDASSPYVDDEDALFLYTALEYENNGRLRTIRNPNGSTTHLVIDGYGTLYRRYVTGGSGEVQDGPRVFVDGLLQPVSVFEGDAQAASPGLHLWTLLQRNSAGLVTQVTEPLLDSSLAPSGYVGWLGGAVHALTYDTMGRAVARESSFGNMELASVVSAYDQLGRLIRRQDAAIVSELSQATVLPNDTRVTAWTYAAGSRDQLEAVHRTATAPLGGSGTTRTTAYDYDSHGRIEAVEDAAQNRTTWYYSAGTDFVSRIERLERDGAAGGTDRTFATDYVVDALGRVLSILDHGSGASTPLTYSFAYNSLGNTTKYTDPAGKEQEFQVDALGRLRWHHRVGTPEVYNSFVYHDFASGFVGSRLKQSDGLLHETETRYDFAGRVASVHMPGAPSSWAPGEVHVANSCFAEYDAASRLRYLHDGDGGTTRLWYDGPGRMIGRELTSAASQLISEFNARDLIARDALGRPLISVSSLRLGPSTFDETVLETYKPDSLGRLHAETFQPFAEGNTLQILSSYTGGDTFRTGLSYLDSLPSGSSPLAMEYSPDAIGRLAQVRWDHSGSPAAPLADFTWLGGRKRSRTTWLSGGPSIVSAFDYDDRGQLSSIEDQEWVGGALQSTLASYGYEYDVASNLTKELYAKQGGGVGDRYGYDDHHRVVRAWLGVNQTMMDSADPENPDGGSTVVQELTYGLDAAQNRTNVTSETSSGTISEDYVLEGETVPNQLGDSNRYAVAGTGTGTLVQPIYDARGNLRFDGTHYLVYDFQNRLSEVYDLAVPGTSGATSGSGQTELFLVTSTRGLEQARESILARGRHDLRELARLGRESRTRTALRETVTSGVRVLSNGGGGMFPSFATEPDLLLVAVYTYDVWNRRINRLVVGEATYNTAWDGWREALQTATVGTQSIPLQQYVYGAGLDELVAYRDIASGSGTPYFVTQGGQDTPSRVVGADGTSYASYEYDVYGKATIHGTMPGYGMPFGWKGIRVDPETGFGYMRNRYYSFVWGRFITCDALGAWVDVVNWGNAYAYVGNRSLILIDRLGRQADVSMVGLQYDTGYVYDERTGNGYRFGEFNGAVLEGSRSPFAVTNREVPRADDPGLTLKVYNEGNDEVSSWIWFCEGRPTKTEGVRELVEFIDRERAKSGFACVSELRITGHNGAPGLVHFGGEDRLTNANVERNGLRMLLPLIVRLCKPCMIHLRSCNTCGDERGVELVKEIARLTGCTVVAYKCAAQAGLQGYPMIIQPDGTVTGYIGPCEPIKKPLRKNFWR